MEDMKIRSFLLFVGMLSISGFAQTIVFEEIVTPIAGVRDSSADFADIDGDNDLNVLIAGRSTENQIIAKLYTNDGNGKFYRSS